MPSVFQGGTLSITHHRPDGLRANHLEAILNAQHQLVFVLPDGCFKTWPHLHRIATHLSFPCLVVVIPAQALEANYVQTAAKRENPFGGQYPDRYHMIALADDDVVAVNRLRVILIEAYRSTKEDLDRLARHRMLGFVLSLEIR